MSSGLQIIGIGRSLAAPPPSPPVKQPLDVYFSFPSKGKSAQPYCRANIAKYRFCRSESPIVYEPALHRIYFALQCARTQNRPRTLAALSLSNLCRSPQTPFLTGASQNSYLFGIGGIPYQKTKICSSCFPPALSRSGGLAEVRPITKSFNSTSSA
jgi:hypothetical protein